MLSFIVSLDKSIGSFNAANDLCSKICFPSDINVKLFNIITNKNEAKLIAKYVNGSVKTIARRKHTIVGIVAYVVVKIVKI